MNNLEGWRRLSYENNEAGMAISLPPRQQSSHVAKLHQTVEQNEELLTLLYHRLFCDLGLTEILLLHPSRRLCNRRCLSVCLSVGLLATLGKNFRTNMHEVFREGWQWANEQMIKVWWRSESRIRIESGSG